MKSKSILASFGLLVILCVSSLNLQAGEPPRPGIDVPVYFSASLLNQMMDRAGCEGIRFYSGQSGTMGESLIAVSVSGGADMPVEGRSFTKYQLFEGIDNKSAIIVEMDMQAARSSVVGVQGAFAVTISNQDISALLSVEGATGLNLIETITPSGQRTLIVYSGVIVEGQATNTANAQMFTAASPCPSACGSDPAANYLVDLSQ